MVGWEARIPLSIHTRVQGSTASNIPSSMQNITKMIRESRCTQTGLAALLVATEPGPGIVCKELACKALGSELKLDNTSSRSGAGEGASAERSRMLLLGVGSI